jgi:hypothetical protein
VSALSLRPSRFRAAKSGASVGTAVKSLLQRRAPIGTTVRDALDGAARVTFTVTKKVAGRRKGRRCVAPARARRGAKACLRTQRLKGSFAHQGTAGQNALRFTGRLRRKALAPGPYTLVPRCRGRPPGARRSPAAPSASCADVPSRGATGAGPTRKPYSPPAPITARSARTRCRRTSAPTPQAASGAPARPEGPCRPGEAATQGAGIQAAEVVESHREADRRPAGETGIGARAADGRPAEGLEASPTGVRLSHLGEQDGAAA